MRSVVGVIACLIMAVAFVALPGAATACSSGKPSAAHAADAASRIVLARVVEAQGPRAYATGYHLAVIEYLKGTGDRDLRIDALVSSLCEDRIAASEGSRVVIAFDVESRGRTLAPYWVIEDDGSVPYGDGRVPDDYTLDDLRGAIEGGLFRTQRPRACRQKPLTCRPSYSSLPLCWAPRRGRAEGFA